MFDGNHVYDLRFVSTKGSEPPYLTIGIKEDDLLELGSRLFTYSDRLSSHAFVYLESESEHFTLPHPDLYGNVETGYRNCGHVTLNDNQVKFHFPLTPENLYPLALTLHVFFVVLTAPFGEERKSNRPQLATISSNAKRDMNGHSVGGWLDNSVTRWIGQYAISQRQKDQKDDAFNAVSPPDPVIIAMKEAWKAVTTGKMKRWSSDCRGFVRENGCFTLVCFGDACDLSIYPDRMYDGGDGAVEFGCHNLDSAPQQITLLAGLAKLLELADSDPDTVVTANE